MRRCHRSAVDYRISTARDGGINGGAGRKEVDLVRAVGEVRDVVKLVNGTDTYCCRDTGGRRDTARVAIIARCRDRRNAYRFEIRDRIGHQRVFRVAHITVQTAAQAHVDGDDRVVVSNIVHVLQRGDDVADGCFGTRRQ